MFSSVCLALSETFCWRASFPNNLIPSKFYRGKTLEKEVRSFPRQWCFLCRESLNRKGSGRAKGKDFQRKSETMEHYEPWMSLDVKLRLTKHNIHMLSSTYHFVSMFISDKYIYIYISLPDISEFIVHIPHVIFDVDGDTRRFQHLHCELLWEGTNEQSSDCVDAGDLIRHADLFGLVPVLQVQHTCRQKAWKHTY